eukprot:CAMPEP_0201502004 /NCGR_PEP_ID=MMETSP0151_2-20130828/83899_1 /ASSEMBLY_ACC=CAM_ASM_000257 /TAXON_ID=200890 /ORGANISM="Paramoeba atlantica, Strain 621/1 / CCAP 1560/9" /LENGTH=105 /DNA_ID=CAMNT_0047895561 /DNA_START=25 /DNA_END=339 /DNA_ORIENTATION=-
MFKSKKSKKDNSPGTVSMLSGPEFELLKNISSNGGVDQVIKIFENRDANLLSKDFQEREYEHYSPLHFAAANGQYEITKMLLEAGVDINAVNSLGDTPTHNASYW